MISEYHINLILSKMDKILEKQDELLAALTAQKVSQERQELEIHMDSAMAGAKDETVVYDVIDGKMCNVKKEKKEPPKVSQEDKKTFREYKRKGGKLGLMTWLKDGKPKQ